MRNNKKNSFMKNLNSVLIALFFAILIRSLLFEPYTIPSGSMKPNLVIGDYIFVSKYKYGYSRYSFPFGVNLFEDRILELNKPKRGDVIVFKLPKVGMSFIKRLIGLPGDEIQLIDNILYVNGKPADRKEIDPFKDTDGRLYRQFIETNIDGVSYKVIQEKDILTTTSPKYVVPEGHYFFMGDNRDNSNDSRFLSKMGYVPAQNIIGKAEIVFFSADAKIWEVWKWFSGLNTERFLTTISSNNE